MKSGQNHDQHGGAEVLIIVIEPPNGMRNEQAFRARERESMIYYEKFHTQETGPGFVSSLHVPYQSGVKLARINNVQCFRV